MKADMRAGCHNCFYWAGHSSFDTGDEINGDCHRYPPSMVGDVASFPKTLGNMVCGEFVSKTTFVDILDRPQLPSNKGADK